ncbi:MAG: hypothetical protein P1U65_05590 [Minwuia sp.]|nr:hypothetical protein [Minwuia sp.]
MRPTVTEPCCICRKDFDFGFGRYDGRYIASWELFICHVCDGRFSGGIPVIRAKELLKQLGVAEVEPEINKKGHISIPSSNS